MAKRVATEREKWTTRTHAGRSFYQFQLQTRGASRAFSVARHIADRYAVQDLLTRGGGGAILQARDLRTGHTVLIKTLAEYDMSRYDLSHPIEDMSESVRRSRHHLQTERRILVQLRNAGCNAVPYPVDYVYDANPALEGPYKTEYGEEWKFEDKALIDTEPYLVMQQIRGRNLRDLLSSEYRRGLDEPTALRIIDQVAGVLDLLEQPLQMINGQTWFMVYQDMKPSNILVDRFARATVLDFGGCQLVIDGTLVLQGARSAGYCAPECETPEQPVGCPADAYTLGTTLFHMLSGVSPRELLPKDRDPETTRAVQLNLEPLRQKCSSAVVDLIARCVDWDATARFQNAGEFRAALAATGAMTESRAPQG